jgi:cell division protein FtsB
MDAQEPVRTRRRNVIPGTISSAAPTYRKSPRKRVSRVDEIELTEVRRKNRGLGKISYMGRIPKSSADWKKFFSRLPYYFLGFLVLRLIFMDRGIIDYHRMDNKLLELKNDLKMGKEEVKALQAELLLIKGSKSYQKKLARDHLGVIGPDEYLVLFAKEDSLPSK